MKMMRTMMDFEFETRKVQNTHFHQNMELLYVLEGGVEIRLESERYELGKGDILLINANKRHSVRETKKELLMVSFRINFSLLAEYLETDRIFFLCNTAADRQNAYGQLRKILDRVLNRFHDKEGEGAIYLNSLYYEALYILVRYFRIKADEDLQKGEGASDNSRVFAIQNYVQANFQKQISLHDLAEKLYLSNAYLSKYIKKRFGLSFLEYVNNVRLFHAVDEMIYSHKKITRIALDNGFPTTAAFNKVFKSVYHMTPSAYRVSVRKEAKEEAPDKTSREQIEQRVTLYLSENAKVQDKIREKDSVVIDADTQRTTELRKNWNEIINIGKMDAVLDSEFQQQILLMKRELGFRYVRIRNVFEDYRETDGKDRYNFRKIDRALDFLVENQLKPYIGMDFEAMYHRASVEVLLAENDQEMCFQERNNYRERMTDFAAHLINRYGIGEVETWYLELWKEGSRNPEENDGYFECFAIGYGVWKQFSGKMKVGGAGFLPGYDREQYRQWIRNWKKQQVRPDFISLCLHSDKQAAENHFVKKQTEVFKEVLLEEAFIPEELHITEWNFTTAPQNIVNDSCAMGAIVMKNCMEAAGMVEKMGICPGGDLSGEFWDTEALLWENQGLLTRDGIKKPSFYSFYFMNFLQTKLLEKTENTVISTDGRDVFSIVCHNCKRTHYGEMIEEEKDAGPEDADQLSEEQGELYLKFRIYNVKNGDYIVRVLYVNREHGSIQDIWRDMDDVRGFSKEDMEYLRQEARPKMEMRKVSVKDGVLCVDAELRAHEIRAIEIRYQY
ncbi:MAG: helix-turn-helix domain-containing protein [Clostridiales bacterium]|nr:helix-turn-helix domain-containing protein [Clostridiales bacterium]